MNILSGKRMEMLDAKLSIYSYMRKTNDEVVIKMSKDLFSGLIAFNSSLITCSSDGLHPHQYKGYFLELVSDNDYVAVAYVNRLTGKIHDIREIKEIDYAI